MFLTSPASQLDAVTDKDDVRACNECARQRFDLTKRGRKREKLPRIIYFGMSRRQIVCPRVRFATENSVVTSDNRYTVVPLLSHAGSNCIVLVSLSPFSLSHAP